MKISMEIKDGKIILTDEQPEKPEEKKVVTEKITKSPYFLSGTSSDIKKTYGVELSKSEKELNLEEKVKKTKEDTNKEIDQEKESIKQEKSIEKEVTKKEFMDAITTEVNLNKREDTLEEKLTKIKNPNRFNTGSMKITMSTIDRPDIDQIADIDKNISGYDRIRVIDSMGRKCDITVINDGYKPSNENEVIEKDSDAIYFIVNRTGIKPEEESWSQAEIMLYPGEAWKIYDVYEMRIRSETQKTRYRITEDDVVIGSTIRSVM